METYKRASNTFKTNTFIYTYKRHKCDRGAIYKPVRVKCEKHGLINRAPTSCVALNTPYIAHRVHQCGPALRTSSVGRTNWAKFFLKRLARSAARRSYASLSSQVSRGTRILPGTSGQLVGTCRPKTGSVTSSAWSIPPLIAARTIARV